MPSARIHELDGRRAGTLFFLQSPDSASTTLMEQRTVCCGAQHAAAVCGEGRLFSWGSGSRGCLGRGTRDDAPKPREVAVGGGARVTALAGADGHMLALDESGCVHAWGEGAHGALGLGSADDCLVPTPVGGALAGRRIAAVSCGAFHSMVLDDTGTVFWWGDGKSLVPREVRLQRQRRCACMRACCPAELAPACVAAGGRTCRQTGRVAVPR